MKKILFITALLAFLLPGATAFAGGHYPAGVEGYKASNMITDGWFYKQYNVFVTADKFTDNNGDKVGNSNLDAFTQLHRFGVHLGRIDAIGANVLMDFAIPLSAQRISSNGWEDSHFGVGDILFEPMLLSWHGERFDALAVVSFFLPTGRYDKDEFSVGSNTWSFLPSVGVVWYLDEEKSWTVSALGRYEINTSNNGVRDGDSVMLEWGIGKNFGCFDVAISGASKVQVRDNSGSNAVTDTRDRMHSIGPELTYTHAEWGMQFSLRSLWEFETANGPKGSMTTFSITKAF